MLSKLNLTGLGQSWLMFSCEGPGILGFAGQASCVANTQFCCPLVCRPVLYQESSLGLYVKWVCLCANKTLFTETGEEAW